MGGVSRQEQLTALHRLDDQAAHRCDAILNDLAGLKVRLSQAEAELTPDSVLGPVGHRLVGVDLEIEAADFRRAHAVEGETAVVVGVDELIGGGRRLRQDAEPGKRIAALVGARLSAAIGNSV